ncbi:type VI secretion system ATPase TssH [Paludibaculum fermentans]|uniref:Type VI secretion system ATPase TssH n=1 Tax=Paludibaculum fermentans TaxID=1473598 RepID=A0A7S7SJ25_PALFE|nr:type VI secretion system ATPase TssH [Paludibaculum fermentans]QOY87622.1 type VI secretion system ATPase TssH [Paludibaculum fermentans]
MAANLKSLVSKLNDTARQTLESAAGLCVARTHYNVEIEHFLLRLLENSDGDSSRIFHHFGLDPSRLDAELNKALDRFKRGNGRTPAFSESLIQMFSDGWTLGSLEYNAASIRTGFTVLALTQNEALWRMARESSRELGRIQPEQLKSELMGIIAGSIEDAEGDEALEEGATPAPARKTGGKTPNLDQFTVNLTEHAKAGKIDSVLGRDTEIRQLVDILMRRRQNNPILTGEAGVGKTAVVEGFATRVANGDVPPALRNVTVRTLDLALLQAGAGVKGEFENRLKGLIEEVKSSATPIILFIDEAHTMIGAGGQAGQNDAANLLKPALARGELRTIAATTWSEYKKYFEKDPALARRFQVVKVEEPSEDVCCTMLRGIVTSLEKHHNVRILDEAVNSAVRLSHRYLAGRQLPDKAVSILDTACARLALGQNSTPPAIEDATREIDDLAVQVRVLEREVAVGADHTERLAKIAERKQKVEAELAALQERWTKESGLVLKVRELRQAIETATPGSDVSAQRAELDKLSAEVAELQGETPLTRACVDAQIVSEVLAAWTGIPVGKMLKDEIQTTLNLASLMGQRVIGQDTALDVIAQRLLTSKASMDDPNRPIGVFMLIGPSGVGKTETALALADLFYGGEKSLITINMSEFQESHTVSTLKGSPPGYVGYGEGGVLTEAVRRRPYSVVLLDEVEKAHPDVLELFYQVFDKGHMEDGEGREIDFKNTIILLTSNACTDTLMKLVADPETAPSPTGLIKAMKPELDKIFKPAFLGRMGLIPYFPVRDEALKSIIRLKVGKVQKRILENHRIPLSYDEAVVDEIANRCTEVESGARNIDNILGNTVLPEISRVLLTEFAEGRRPAAFQIAVGEGGQFVYTSTPS